MRALVAGLLALSLFAATKTVVRDWQRFPAVVRIDTAGEIFAVGDVHGDYDRLVTLLAGARIIDDVPASPEKARWKAGAATVVFTGDLIDKGPKCLAVLACVRALQAAAAAAGGRVVVLAGNHEAEFLADPSATKGADFAGQLSEAGLSPAEVAACRGDLGEYLCSLPFAARVGDWFFSHAGNTAGRTLDHLAADIQKGFDHEGFGAPQLIGDDSLLEARIGAKGKSGRSWYDAGAPRIDAARLLSGYAGALEVRHIVEGHHHGEAQFPDGAIRRVGEMYQWRGRLFLIDTGMSRGVGDSAGAVLHISAGSQQAAAICPDGRATAIWDGRQPDKTGRAAPCKPAR
jgi:hypothetical protein